MAALAKEELRAIAQELAPFILEEVRKLMHPESDYLHGTQAIARFLGISDDTVRRRIIAKKIPVAGWQETRHRGRASARPTCKISELRAAEEQFRSVNHQN